MLRLVYSFGATQQVTLCGLLPASPMVGIYVGSSDGKVYAFADHDIAVKDVGPSKTIVGSGYSTSIRAYIVNRGYRTEIFNVTAYANTTVIETKEITLTSRDSLATTFTWNTTGWTKGNYTIKAKADTVPAETDTTDNTHIDGWVFVTILGDVNGDLVVDGSDVVIVIEHVLSYW